MREEKTTISLVYILLMKFLLLGMFFYEKNMPPLDVLDFPLHTNYLFKSFHLTTIYT